MNLKIIGCSFKFYTEHYQKGGIIYLSNLAYKDDIILSEPSKYTCNVGREAANMAKKQKREIDYNKIQIIHTIPKMDDIDREKRKKAIGDELYEIFLRIQSQLEFDSENSDS